MATTLDIMIVILAVGAAAWFLARSFIGKRKKKSGCGAGSCSCESKKSTPIKPSWQRK